MAGVGFDHQPNLTVSFQLQRVTRGKSQVDFHLHAAIYASRNNHVAPLQRNQPPGNYVTGAEPYRLCNCQQDVAGTNSHSQPRPCFGANQRRLQKNTASRLTRQTAGHRSSVFVYGLHDGIEDIFKTGELRHGLLKWSAQHLVRRALRYDAALIHQQHTFAQGHYFFAAMRDIQNRDAVNLIPAAEIVDDSCLGRCVQSGERFVEEKYAWVSH